MTASGSDSFSPSDVEPMGATIAVAFTGAAIGLVGAVLSLVAGDPGLVLIAVGVVIALASPVAYFRVRSLQGR